MKPDARHVRPPPAGRKVIFTHGCHRCRFKPKPGTPYHKTACAQCVFAESVSQGHGRGLSYQDLERILFDPACNPVAEALADMTESGPAPRSGEDAGLSFNAAAPPEESCAVLVPDRLARFVRCLFDLPPAPGLAVVERLAGLTIREIARRHGWLEPEAAYVVSFALVLMPDGASMLPGKTYEDRTPTLQSLFAGSLDPERLARLRGFFAAWAGLSERVRKAVTLRLFGCCLRSIGEALDMTLQGAWWNIETARRTIPALDAALKTQDGKAGRSRSEKMLALTARTPKTPEDLKRESERITAP